MLAASGLRRILSFQVSQLDSSCMSPVLAFLLSNFANLCFGLVPQWGRTPIGVTRLWILKLNLRSSLPTVFKFEMLGCYTRDILMTGAISVAWARARAGWEAGFSLLSLACP